MTKRVNKFNHSKRLVLAVVVGISAIGLVGCGDGGSGMFGVGGTGAAINAQVTFKVDNTSGYDIKTVQIVDKTGQQLLKSDFSCAKDASCNFQAPMNQAGALKFYDKQGALVGAYVLAQAPKQTQIVKPSAYMLGMYVFSELQSRYPEAPALLTDKVNQLFTNYQSSDGKADKYQELGQYYRVSAVGSKQSNDEFLKDLHQKLEEGKPLPADLYQLKAPSVKSTGRMALKSAPSVQSGGEGGCPSGLSALATIAQAASNFAGSIYPGIGFIGGIVEAGCGMATPEDKRLDEIQAKLDEMAATLTANGLALDKLTEYAASEGANNVLKDTVNKVSAANRNIDYYENLIQGHGSFKAFVDANGSFEKAWKKYPVLMEGLFKKFSEDWSALTLVGQPTDKSSLTRAFGLLCDGHDSPNVDIVKNRKVCNGYILNYQSLVLGTYLKHMSMLKDITATLNENYEKEKTFIKGNVVMPSPVKATWADSYTSVMLPKLQAGLNGVADSFAPDNISIVDSKGAYFNLYAGLPTQLMDQFQTDGLKSTCTQGSPIGRQSKPVPNITKWVNNGENSFITVVCREAIGSSNKFTSNYYLSDGNDVVNLMGVLIGKNAKTSTTETVGSTQGAETLRVRVPVAWPVFTTNADFKDLPSVVSPGVAPGSRIVSEGKKDAFNIYMTNYSGYERSGANISKLYARYTAKAKNGQPALSYIFALYFWRGTLSSLRYSQGCLGKNCTSGDGVSYKDGPNIKFWMTDFDGDVSYTLYTSVSDQ